jgi:hypothetical protein
MTIMENKEQPSYEDRAFDEAWKAIERVRNQSPFRPEPVAEETAAPKSARVPQAA